MRVLLVLLLVFSVGCATKITQLNPLLPKWERNINNETVDSFLKHRFTDKAYQYLKDIPLVDGFCYTPFVSGVNVWSNLASFFTLNGVGRKVIFEKEMISKWGRWVLYMNIYIMQMT